MLRNSTASASTGLSSRSQWSYAFNASSAVDRRSARCWHTASHALAPYPSRLASNTTALDLTEALHSWILGSSRLVTKASSPDTHAQDSMPQSSTLRRYGVAFLAVAVATLIRSSFNQVLGIRFPLLLHAFAIAVAAEYGGTIPGLIATGLGVMVTTFFYMQPLYSFRVSDPTDILALSAFSIVGIAFSLFGGRRIALLTRLQTLTEELEQRVEEVETVLDVAPVAIWVSRDPHCLKITGNPMANRFYEAGVGENVSAGSSVPIESKATPKIQARRFFHNGIELRADELPMQQAVAQNWDVRNSELEVLLPSGRCIHMLGHASPLRDVAGKVRGCVGAFLDITELKEGERAIHALNSKLENSSIEFRF